MFRSDADPAFHFQASVLVEREREREMDAEEAVLATERRKEETKETGSHAPLKNALVQNQAILSDWFRNVKCMMLAYEHNVRVSDMLYELYSLLRQIDTLDLELPTVLLLVAK